MGSLHPHWQATDAGKENIRIIPKQPHMPMKRASRRPAAFTGIALIAIAGFAVFQSMNHLSDVKGQLAAPVTITIRANGVDPKTVTVDPGATITWRNEDTIPHILSSETFPTSDGQPFATSAIFPGSNTHILVPTNAAGATHAYISQTSQTVIGEIIIRGSGNAAATATTSSSVAQLAISSSVSSSSAPAGAAVLIQSSQPTAVTQISSAASVASATQSSRASVAATAGIAVNPHTIGTVSASVGQPDTSDTPAINSLSSYPMNTTESGPTLWIVITASVAAILFATRKMFRKI